MGKTSFQPSVSSERREPLIRGLWRVTAGFMSLFISQLELGEMGFQESGVENERFLAGSEGTLRMRQTGAYRTDAMGQVPRRASHP